MYYIDENIKNLERITYQNNRKAFLRLDLNENPGGLPEDFVNEVISEVTSGLVSQYPETEPFETCLANFLGIKRENICLVNGSSEGVRHIIEAYTNVGGEIVGVTPSYAMYEVYAKMYGRVFKPVKYNEDLTISVDSIIDSISDNTQLLILLNPNNPIGNAYSNEEFERILAAAKEHQITVMIDEAYMYFYNNTFIKAALENPHVFIVRTFSKLFSLAGLRLGYVVGQPEDVKTVSHLCTPHNTNAVAMLFAQRILEKEGFLDSIIKKQLDGKQYLIETLKKNGYIVSAQEGNFIFVKPKCLDADEIVSLMYEKKMILVKSYNNLGEYGKCLRVSTGEKEYMQRFIDALIDLDKVG